MTGLDRLRELADMLGKPLRSGREALIGMELGAIADRIEAEQEERITRRVEDREAAEWVRERGGLDYVKSEWSSRVPYDRYEARRQRLLGHIAECESALGRRRVRIEELGHRVSDLTNENAELRRRAMPEGMEWLADAWPRFEDGEFVKLGDKGLDIRGDIRSVEGVKFTQGGFVFISDDMGRTWWANDQGPMEDPCIDPAKRVKRPAPKVLDADGAEIRAGEMVYHIETGDEFTVIAVDAESGDVHVRWGYDFEDKTGTIDGSYLTHRAPVLAADGIPLEVGQTVWSVNDGREYKVVTVESPVQFDTTSIKVDDGKAVGGVWIRPDNLTHQRPVLDADGNRIETGLDVWWVCEGDGRGIHAEKLHVEGIDEDGMVECSPYNGGTSVVLESSELYVKKPVLDADGVPIKKGDTVYLLSGKWCDEFPCLGFHGGEELEVFADDEPQHVAGGVQCRDKKKGFEFRGTCYPQPSQLTHTKPEPPDTWDQIKADADLCPFGYVKKFGKQPEWSNAEFQRKDLVRRCKELAEKGETK